MGILSNAASFGKPAEYTPFELPFRELAYSGSQVEKRASANRAEQAAAQKGIEDMGVVPHDRERKEEYYADFRKRSSEIYDQFGGLASKPGYKNAMNELIYEFSHNDDRYIMDENFKRYQKSVEARAKIKKYRPHNDLSKIQREAIGAGTLGSFDENGVSSLFQDQGYAENTNMEAAFNEILNNAKPVIEEWNELYGNGRELNAKNVDRGIEQLDYISNEAFPGFIEGLPGQEFTRKVGYELTQGIIEPVISEEGELDFGATVREQYDMKLAGRKAELLQRDRKRVIGIDDYYYKNQEVDSPFREGHTALGNSNTSAMFGELAQDLQTDENGNVSYTETTRKRIGSDFTSRVARTVDQLNRWNAAYYITPIEDNTTPERFTSRADLSPGLIELLDAYYARTGETFPDPSKLDEDLEGLLKDMQEFYGTERAGVTKTMTNNTAYNNEVRMTRGAASKTTYFDPNSGDLLSFVEASSKYPDITEDLTYVYHLGPDNKYWPGAKVAITGGEQIIVAPEAGEIDKEDVREWGESMAFSTYGGNYVTALDPNTMLDLRHKQMNHAEMKDYLAGTGKYKNKGAEPRITMDITEEDVAGVHITTKTLREFDWVQNADGKWEVTEVLKEQFAINATYEDFENSMRQNKIDELNEEAKGNE